MTATDREHDIHDAFIDGIIMMSVVNMRSG